MTNRIALFILLMSGLVAGLAAGCQSQTRPESKGFTISVESVADGFHLTCETGCAWTELSWKAPDYLPVSIDSKGMMPADAPGLTDSTEYSAVED